MTRWFPAIGSLILAAVFFAPRTSQADEKDAHAQ